MTLSTLKDKLFFPFIAPPNGGKGTQTVALLKAFPGLLSKIDMGGLLRAAAQDENNPLGQKIRDAQGQGQLVDITIVIDVLKEGLAQVADENPHVVGFILDGFPRNDEQLEKLGAMADNVGARIAKAIYLMVPEQVIVDRAAGRIFQKDTHEPFNIRIEALYPPGFDLATFDLSNSNYYQRDDDKEETVVKRLASFKADTEPMIEVLRVMGLLAVIDGNRSPDAITTDILSVVQPAIEAARKTAV